MATNYSKYSARRRAIQQQVRRLEKRGYTVPEQYKLPTVKELRSMSQSERSTYVKRAAQIKTASVRKHSYVVEYSHTKAGSLKTVKVDYSKASKKERSASSQKGWKTRVKKQEERNKRIFKQEREEYRRKYESEMPKDDYDYRADRAARAEEYKRNYGEYPAWYQQDIREGTAIGQSLSGKVAGDLTEEEQQLRLEGKDELFEQYAQEFIDSAPLSDKYNAEAYIQELREGKDVGSFEDFIANLEDEPSAMDTFDLKLENLDQVSPETADYMRKFYNRVLSQVGEDEMNRRFANAKEIPDFDTPYETKTGGHTVGYGAVAKMLSIIKGRPASGAELRALGRAMEKDENL